MNQDGILRTCIIWIAFMVVGAAVSLLKPELLRTNTAFAGLAYAFMSWVIAMVAG